MVDKSIYLMFKEFSLRVTFPILFITIIVEYIFGKRFYDWKESLQGFGIAAVSTVIAVFNKAAALGAFTAVFLWAEPLREEYLGYTTLGWALPIWFACAIADDFNFYWHHRFAHTVRVLWAAHSPHHNAHEYNLTISIRNGWFITFFKPLYWMWLPLVGFEPAMIACCLLINSTFQFFLHSRLVPSFGPIEWVFNTPWLHQVHHSSNTQYLDKNHGGILIIWDRIFGTFKAPEKGVDAKFGVIKDPKSYNPIKANTFEFEQIWADMKTADTFTDKIKYLFWPPGWKHDGTGMTAKEMQKIYQETGKDPQDDMHDSSQDFKPTFRDDEDETPDSGAEMNKKEKELALA